MDRSPLYTQTVLEHDGFDPLHLAAVRELGNRAAAALSRFKAGLRATLGNITAAPAIPTTTIPPLPWGSRRDDYTLGR